MTTRGDRHGARGVGERPGWRGVEAGILSETLPQLQELMGAERARFS